MDEDIRAEVEPSEEGEEGPIEEDAALADEERPRRRRRRRRRRPGERIEEPQLREPLEDQEEEAESEGEPAEDRTTEPLARGRYEDVPTWEEAISYLVRVRGEPPRGRSDDRRGPRRPRPRGDA